LTRGMAWAAGAAAIAGAGAVLAAPGPAARAAATQQTTVPCSVRALSAAIAAAASGTTLELPDKCTYRLATALPAVGTPLTIAGNGSTIERSTAPGTPDFTMLTVASGGSLTVRDLSFRDGTAQNAAAAIVSDGTLTVTGGAFTGNTTSGYGAAIGNYGTLTVSGAAFSGNRAADGGAIVNFGTATITASSFQGNEASFSGGALHNEGSISITGGAFTGNTATADGGGLFNGVDGTRDTVSGTNFSGNHARNGGSLYNEDVLTLTGALIAGSSAAGDGGGIYSDWVLTAARSAITANTAAGDGGGLYNGSDFGSPGSVTFTSVMFAGNQPDDCAPATVTCSGVLPGGPVHAGPQPAPARPPATARALARDFHR
jgi:hypothetical protein